MGQRMNYFEKNLKAMEQWYPKFVEMIQEKKEEKEDKDGTKVYVERSLDGETIFLIEINGRKLYLGGKRNALEPVKMWQERLGKIHKYAPVFLFGTGSGMYLKSIIKNSPKEANVVVYEPSIHIFLAVLENIDLSAEIEDRPIAFIVEGINEEEFIPVMRNVLVLETLEFLKEEVHPNYKQAFPEKLEDKLRKLAKHAGNFMVHFHTRKLLQKRAAQNVLYNLPYVAQGYNTLQLSKAIPHDGAAILVSAGPSLNKNVEELKRAKNHIFILAVDTAVKPLMKHGICPDAFITLDGRKPVELLEAEGAEKLPVISNPVARYELLDRQEGKKIFFFDGYQLPLQLYILNGQPFGNVAIGGSVACSGFSLLYKMGFETVILVGQDLAYTDKKSHADGTFQEKMPEENTENMLRVKGNYEEEVPTLTNLKLYLDWFEYYIKGAKEKGSFRVINATEGGAYIEGTELMTLKDAIQECRGEETDFEELAKNVESAFSTEERKKAFNYLEEIPKQLEELGKIARQLKREYGKVKRLGSKENNGGAAYRKILKRVKKLTDNCDNYPAYQLVEETLGTAEFILKTEYYYEEEERQGTEIQAVAEHGIRYSEIMEECADLIHEMSLQMLERAKRLKTEEELYVKQ